MAQAMKAVFSASLVSSSSILSAADNISIAENTPGVLVRPRDCAGVTRIMVEGKLFTPAGLFPALRTDPSRHTTIPALNMQSR